MSQENVAIVQAALAAWNARDMQALTELLDPYMVARMPEGWFEPISFGRDAVMRGWEEARGIWENDMLDPLSDFIDVGNRVALRFTWRGEAGSRRAHAVHRLLHGARRADLLSGVVLGSHRSSRGPGAVGARRSCRLLNLLTARAMSHRVGAQ
jgi:hypothetical protein